MKTEDSVIECLLENCSPETLCEEARRLSDEQHITEEAALGTLANELGAHITLMFESGEDLLREEGGFQSR